MNPEGGAKAVRSLDGSTKLTGSQYLWWYQFWTLSLGELVFSNLP